MFQGYECSVLWFFMIVTLDDFRFGVLSFG